jgi:hypothetical protein
VDCEKEITMYRIIQVTSLPSLATHSPVDCEKEIKMSCTFLSLSHNSLVNV